MKSLQDLWIEKPADQVGLDRCTSQHAATFSFRLRCVFPANHAGGHLGGPYGYDYRVSWAGDGGEIRVRDIPHPDRPALFPLRDGDRAAAAMALIKIWDALEHGQISPREAQKVIGRARSIVYADAVGTDEVTEVLRGAGVISDTATLDDLLGQGRN